MSRLSPFDVPHKGIRNALSQLSLLAGKTNYNNAPEVAALFELGKSVFSILSIHAHDENEGTLRHLEEKLPGASAHDMLEHEQIETLQEELENCLKQLYENSENGAPAGSQGTEFYSRLNDFHALYLQHMAAEEKETQPLLWKFFSDEELADHRREIISRNPPGILLTWFRFVVPAQSHSERIALLKGFKVNAPKAFFQEGMQAIGMVLPDNEFQKLQEALT
jgi:hypothetical protein